MGGKLGKIESDATDPRGVGWPVGARRAVSAGIAVHAAAVLAAALAWPPSSSLETAVAGVFAVYYQVLDQGYAYRYYAPEPGPTPIVTARVRFADGRPEKTLRLPSRGLWPRLRYQRQLALANHLVAHFEETRQATGDGSTGLFARSFARHIARSNPGSVVVTLYTQLHLIPHPQVVRDALEAGKPVDIDAEEFYTAPERIGEFPCDGL